MRVRSSFLPLCIASLISSPSFADCSTDSPPTCAYVAASGTGIITPSGFTATPTKLGVINNCSATVMVPMSNQTSWDSFYNNPQSCVTVGTPCTKVLFV